MKKWTHPNTYTWASIPPNSETTETAGLLRDIGGDVYAIYDCEATTAEMADAWNYEVDRLIG